MRWRDLKQTLHEASIHWSEHAAPRLSAALSFYAILSLAPLLVISVTIASQFLDSGSIRETMREQVTDSLGAGTSDLILGVVDHASKLGTGLVATFLATFIAIYAASGLFTQIVESIEHIWEIRREGHPVRLFFLARLKAVVLLLAFLILFVTWLLVDSVLGWLGRVSGGFAYWPFISIFATTGFATVVFALVYVTIPRRRARKSEGWLGGLVAGLGFSIAKFLLSLYFTYSGVAAAYGSAGALVVILLWIYYSSQLFFYGVEVTRVVVTRREHDQSIEVGEPSTGSTIESPTE